MTEFESRVNEAASTYDGLISTWHLTINTCSATYSGQRIATIRPETLPLHVLKELQEWAATGIAAYAEADPK